MVNFDPATAFAVFDRQDSGCISYGIEWAGRRLFVKTATTSAGYESLGRAIFLHRSVRHPAIVAPMEVVDTRKERLLVYPWQDGVVLNHATVDGSDRSGLDRFRNLPVQHILAALGTIFEAHVSVAAAGFVSVDIYDGCFLYEFDRHAMHLIDLDEYRPGPFAVAGARLPGSTRYMAPEEFMQGSVIDERTSIFHMGRAAEQLLGEANLTAAQRHVVTTATHVDRAQRFSSLREMVQQWRSASDD